MSSPDARWMVRALELARRGQFTVTPNPAVGCVLVKEGRVIGEGWHVRAGEPHAEVNALNACKSSPEGATAYVTLEPCSHDGRTGPCCEALRQAGVSRVVSAMEDPNPAVKGKGRQFLRAAGIDVMEGVLEPEARRLNRGFCTRMKTGLPWVTVKLAISLDGRTALEDGTSEWITSAQSRADVQRERALSCAVLTGRGTVQADDPRLDVRWHQSNVALPSDEVWYGDRPLAQLTAAGMRQPARIVLDSKASAEPISNVYSNTAERMVVVSSGGVSERRRRSFEEVGVKVVSLPGGVHQGVDLHSVMRMLGARGINRLWVEGGATLATALWESGLVDEWILYQSPVVLGERGRPSFAFSVNSMADRGVLSLQSCVRIGPDVKMTFSNA